MYDIARSKFIDPINYIKNNSIELDIKHVSDLIEETGRFNITNQKISVLHSFFEDKFSIKNILVMVYWVEPIIDLDKSRNRVKSMIRCQCT